MLEKRTANTTGYWIAIVLVLVFVAAYHGTVLPVIVTALGDVFPVSGAAIGFLLASTLAGAVFSGALAGPLIDTVGPRLVLVFSTLIIALSLFSASVSRSLAFFVAAAIGISVAHHALNMSIPLYVISLRPAWRRKSFALSLVIGVVPGIAFPFLVEKLLSTSSFTTESVFRTPYLLSSILCGFLFLVIAFRAPGRREAIPHRMRSDHSSVLKRFLFVVSRRKTWVFVILMSLHGSADNAIYQWFPTFLTTRFDEVAIGPGATLSLFSVA